MGDLNESPVAVLSCGHTYHSECILQYMTVTGKSKSEACPLKCHRSIVDISFAPEFDAEPSPSSPIPTVQADPQDLADASEAQIAASSVID